MYAEMIRESAAKQGFLGANVRWVEAWMRGEHPCLDGLTRGQFDREVRAAIQCIQEAGPEMSEAVAKSHGI